jgi:hypothetical protein
MMLYNGQSQARNCVASHANKFHVLVQQKQDILYRKTL